MIRDGYARGRRIKVGDMAQFMGKGLARRNGFGRKEPIYLYDKTIIKYLHHPKRLKGATVPDNLMNLMIKAVQRPKNIYRDVHPKNADKLILVGTIPKEKNKLIKAVIHTRYNIRGYRYHVLKSYGIIEKRNIETRDYLKIR
ncbi:MAG: hypothetical protein NC117_10965 [Pseudoflavonifractor sp.]|nr:hypothetical protein [Pseudoflavonifractor sp.]